MFRSTQEGWDEGDQDCRRLAARMSSIPNMFQVMQAHSGRRSEPGQRWVRALSTDTPPNDRCPAASVIHKRVFPPSTGMFPPITEPRKGSCFVATMHGTTASTPFQTDLFGYGEIRFGE